MIIEGHIIVTQKFSSSNQLYYADWTLVTKGLKPEPPITGKMLARERMTPRRILNRISKMSNDLKNFETHNNTLKDRRS